jgi:hypothetical protein
MLRRLAFSILPAVLVVLFVGCGDTHPAQVIKNDSAGTNAVAPKESVNVVAEDAPGLKELDEADRELSKKQKLCPISGESLGSMGPPVKMTVKGRVIFLCCSGCVADVKKDEDGTLKKVDALLAKK